MATLVPIIRSRAALSPSRYPKKACIALHTHKWSKQSVVKLGRLELLSSFYAACGCDNNIYSTKRKCTTCQQIKWASRFLSRKMLRISLSPNGEARLSVRGSFVAVLVAQANGTEFTTISPEKSSVRQHPSEWRGNHLLSSGTRILLQEPNGEGEMEFRVYESSRSQQMTIYMVRCGQDLPGKRIELFSNQLRERGILLTEDYRQATHLVVSKFVRNFEHLAAILKCTENGVRRHLDENRIQCLLPGWVSRSPKKPAGRDFWLGYVSKSLKGVPRNKSYLSVSRSIIPMGHASKSLGRKNDALADQFVKLSKAYEKASLYPEEEWKALQFHKLAGRLQSLDFEITGTSRDFDRLKVIPDLGKSGIDLIRGFLAKGSLTRLEELSMDPLRNAIGDLSSIHGIGRVTALSLYQQGYRSIEDVRRGIASMALFLSREQLIGVECYEDIREEIDRDEAEQIGNLVIDAFHSISDTPAEATIMGSFRRGKSTCGDVDVLITMKKHRETIPRDALPRLIRFMKKGGHIAHHITHVRGLETLEENLSKSSIETSISIHPKPSMVAPSKWRPVPSNFSKHRGSSKSYMGVFHSPKIKGKRRRVDIKIYPYNQKGFASLYFTGGKWFNRSMRLWATQKNNWKLTDKGLVDISTGKQVMKKAHREEDVFHKLGLKYKAPSDRGYFDDVEPL